MPKTGFPAPTMDSTPEEILEYIRYKQAKMEKLMLQSKKYLAHVLKARKMLDIVMAKKNLEN